MINLFIFSCNSWTTDVEAVSKQLLLRAVQCVVKRKDSINSQVWEADQIYLGRISFTEVLLDACLAVKWKPILGVVHTDNMEEKEDANNVDLKATITEKGSNLKKFTTHGTISLKTDCSVQVGTPTQNVKKNFVDTHPPTPFPRTIVSKARTSQDREKEPTLETSKGKLPANTAESSILNVVCVESCPIGDVYKDTLMSTPDDTIVPSQFTISTPDGALSDIQIKVSKEKEISTSTTNPVKQLAVSALETKDSPGITKEDNQENVNLELHCTSGE